MASWPGSGPASAPNGCVAPSPVRRGSCGWSVTVWPPRTSAMRHPRGGPIGRRLTPMASVATPRPAPPATASAAAGQAAVSVPDAAHRRTICVWLPRLRSEVECRLRPDPMGRPIAVFDPTKRLRPLLEAPEDGPPVGMPLREAESRWPDVAYRADAPADDARAIEPVLEVLAELSP